LYLTSKKISSYVTLTTFFLNYFFGKKKGKKSKFLISFF
jgi:hypothetical protein